MISFRAPMKLRFQNSLTLLDYQKLRYQALKLTRSTSTHEIGESMCEVKSGVSINIQDFSYIALVKSKQSGVNLLNFLYIGSLEENQGFKQLLIGPH